MKRCINIDWLEVYCIEPEAIKDAVQYFTNLGYNVIKRSYGTPIYSEVLTLCEGQHKVYEIRRLPYSLKENGGIMQYGATHIRLCNKTCYLPDSVARFHFFLSRNHYIFKAISRVDICNDFVTFDNNAQPQLFITRYLQGKYIKVNQSYIAAVGKHKNNIYVNGRSLWADKVFNYIRWGGKQSIVQVRLYNKTLEMREVKNKPYIIDIWQQYGMPKEKDVWRVEFQVEIGSKPLYNKLGEIKTLTLEDIQNNLLQIFNNLASHYFYFVIAEKNKFGVIKRKDKAKQYCLFTINTDKDAIFKPLKVENRKQPNPIDYDLLKRLKQIRQDVTLPIKQRMAAYVVAKHIVANYAIDDPSINDLMLTYE